MSDPISHYRQEFQRLQASVAATEPEWLQQRRAGALEDFIAAGFPSLRDERWKYTNLSRLSRQEFSTATGPAHADPAVLEGARLKELRGPELVFVNGLFCKEMSSRLQQDAVDILPLRSALSQGDLRLEERLGATSSEHGGTFTALNGAFMTDGAYLRIGANARAPAIHLIFIAAGNTPVAIYPRVLIDVDAAAQGQVIETYVGGREVTNFTNAVTEIRTGDGARLEHYRIQRESPLAFHMGGLYLDTGRDSTITGHSVAWGAALARVDAYANLRNPGAHVELNGLYLPRDNQHLDHHIHVDHAVAHTSSDIFYKGVLDDHARAVFNGQVVVHPDAQKTDARQTNKNLMLSSGAEVDTKPELEIYADDVQCSHGATVGQLDGNALFYMKSRGIEDATARGALTFAFADDVIKRMNLDPVKLPLERAILERLPHGAIALEEP